MCLIKELKITKSTIKSHEKLKSRCEWFDEINVLLFFWVSVNKIIYVVDKKKLLKKI